MPRSAATPSDGGVHPPAERRLRRRGQRDRSDAGDLGRDHVHDDARRVDGLAAGHVEAHAADGLPALHDLRAVAEHGRLGRGHLRRARGAHAVDGALDRVADLGGELVAGLLELVGRHPEVRRAHAVEPLGLFDERRLAVLADLVDESASGLERRRDIGRGARDEGEQFAR